MAAQGSEAVAVCCKLSRFIYLCDCLSFGVTLNPRLQRFDHGLTPAPWSMRRCPHKRKTHRVTQRARRRMQKRGLGHVSMQRDKKASTAHRRAPLKAAILILLPGSSVAALTPAPAPRRRTRLPPRRGGGRLRTSSCQCRFKSGPHPGRQCKNPAFV